MNSKSLEYMIALYKTGSMTRAAKELYVSQSNLSQFLKNEEAELGTKLFTREHGKYVPTEAGKIYIEYATQVQEMTTTFRRKIAELSKPLVLQIGTTSSVAIDMLHAILPELHKIYPGVHVSIINCDNLDIAIYSLDHGTLDAVLITAPGENCYREPSFVMYKEEILFTAPSTLSASEALLKKHRKKLPALTPSSLRRLFGTYPFILQYPRSCIRILVDQFFADSDFSPRVAGTASNTQTILGLIYENMGVGFIPKNNIKSMNGILYFSLEPKLERVHMMLIRSELKENPAIVYLSRELKKYYSNYFSDIGSKR